MTADDPTYEEVIAAAAPVARPFLDAIQARADAASPAPWDWNDDNDGEGAERHWTVSNGYPEDAATLHTGEWLSKADAVFIAHARQDVPALLAALAAERARADEAERESVRNRLFGIGVQNQLHAAEVRIADAPHEPTCFVHSHRGVARYCNCWKSAAPTAEQGADPSRCPKCRHAEHDGFECLNMASDNNCACKYGLRRGADQ